MRRIRDPETYGPVAEVAAHLRKLADSIEKRSGHVKPRIDLYFATDAEIAHANELKRKREGRKTK